MAYIQHAFCAIGGHIQPMGKVRITDGEVKKLIQLAMVPNKEVLRNIQTGNLDELSTCFMNICDKAYDYSQSHYTQQMDND